MPSAFDGLPIELLVLGSAHLNEETTDDAPHSTLKRLLAWQPQAMAVENLPGDVVQGYRMEGDLYAGLRVGGYPVALKLGAEASQHRPWSRSEAEAVALHPDTLPAERVLAWLVALEPANALLHWTPDLQLPPDVADSMAEYAARKGEIHRLKRKISGGFRSVAGGEAFCRIRSYVSTLRKQGMNMWQGLVSVFRGDILMPDFSR